MLDLSNINTDMIIKLLDYFSIKHTSTHSELNPEKAVGVCCPFCEENNFHGAIFKESKIF